VKLRRFAVLSLVASACVFALAGCGKSTSITAANPVLDETPPSPPSTLSSSYLPTVGYDYLYWNASSSASVRDYEVWESASIGGTKTKIATMGLNDDHVVLPAVAANCVRYYSVRAQSNTGTFSAFSAAIGVDRHASVVLSSGGNGSGDGVGIRMTD
jgi:hypothetical protein